MKQRYKKKRQDEALSRGSVGPNGMIIVNADDVQDVIRLTKDFYPSRRWSKVVVKDNLVCSPKGSRYVTRC